MAADLDGLRIRIFADGADRDTILRYAKESFVQGFTTNPSLLRKAGVGDYETFGREILELVPDRPFSFEVMSDDFEEMERQALSLADWGDNVFVKVPITNCRGESSAPLLERLAHKGVALNVTALMTVEQVSVVAEALAGGPPAYVSVFAGRIADTGRDPVPIMREAVDRLVCSPQLQLIWASPREVLNLYQADAVGCDVITMTDDLLRKIDLMGKDLEEFSLETVRMFFDDARLAGYTI